MQHIKALVQPADVPGCLGPSERMPHSLRIYMAFQSTLFVYNTNYYSLNMYSRIRRTSRLQVQGACLTFFEYNNNYSSNITSIRLFEYSNSLIKQQLLSEIKKCRLLMYQYI